MVRARVNGSPATVRCPEQGKEVTVVTALAAGSDGLDRCAWCVGDPVYEAYHDDEWGQPIRDDAQLFGLLMLEGFQAGLSWRTILYKRENFERAFHGWEPETIANMTTRISSG